MFLGRCTFFNLFPTLLPASFFFYLFILKESHLLSIISISYTTLGQNIPVIKMAQPSAESLAGPRASEESLPLCILPELGKLRMSKEFYRQTEYTYTLTTLPLDIILLIADHLHSVDRTMLWLTCKTFHDSIPMKGYHPIACPSARVRAMRLLYDSPLLPYFGHNSKFLCMTRSRRNVRKAVEKLQKCSLCNFFSKMGKNLQCPFHPPIDKGLYSFPRFRPLTRDERIMRKLTSSSSLSLQSYIKGCLPRVLDKLGSCSVSCQKAGFPASWDKELRNKEELYNSQVRERQQMLGIARSSHHYEPTKWRDENWRINFADFNIWVFFLCNHCMNILPDNSPMRGACAFCGCSDCGMSKPKLLRVCEPGEQPRVVILGQIAFFPRN